jgi:uncharacterized membrane protein YagU involved in acid resistance
MSVFAPLRRAVIAGAVGTLAMDALLYQRYRRNGGSDSFVGWEFGGPAATFSEAGAPAQIGEALASRFDIKLPESSARLTNNVVHWATGIGWGVVHSVVRTVTPMATLASGVAAGAASFGTSYAVLPRMGIYKPLSEYDGETLWRDLSAHLVYGAATGATAGVLRGLHKARKALPIP